MDQNSNQTNADYEDVSTETENLEKLISIVQILNDKDFFTEKYKFSIQDYLIDRKIFAEKILEIADEIQRIVKKAGIAKVAKGGTSILAGALAIGGIVLAPVTAGGSLGMTYAGVAGGIAAGITGVTSEIIKNRKIKKNNAEIKLMKDSFIQREDVLVKLFDDFKHLSEAAKDLEPSTLDTVLNNLEVAKGIKYGVKTYYSGLKMVEVVSSVGGNLQKASAGMASSVASPGTSTIFGNTLIAAGGTTATVLSSSLAVLGIGFGTWDLVSGINDSNKSKVADNLRDFCIQYQQQTEGLTVFFDGIRKIATTREE